MNVSIDTTCISNASNNGDNYLYTKLDSSVHMMALNTSTAISFGVDLQSSHYHHYHHPLNKNDASAIQQQCWAYWEPRMRKTKHCLLIDHWCPIEESHMDLLPNEQASNMVKSSPKYRGNAIPFHLHLQQAFKNQQRFHGVTTTRMAIPCAQLTARLASV